MNYGTSSNQHGDVVVEASNEEPYVFESDTLCMIVGLVDDDQQSGDVLARVDEEMVEMEMFLTEHVFVEFEDGGFDKEIVEVKDTLNYVPKEYETTSSHGDYSSVEYVETLHEYMIKEIPTIGMQSEIFMPAERSTDEDEMELLDEWLT